MQFWVHMSWKHVLLIIVLVFIIVVSTINQKTIQNFMEEILRKKSYQPEFGGSLGATMTQEEFYKNFFITVYERDFVYHSLISIYFFSIVSAVILIIGLVFGVLRGWKRSQQKSFFKILLQLTLANLVGIFGGAAEKIPTLIIFPELREALEFNNTWIANLFRGCQKFSFTYGSLMLFIMVLYIYIMLIIPNYTQILRKYLWVKLFIAFFISIGLSLGLFMYDCNTVKDWSAGYESIYRYRLTCPRIINRFTVQKLEWALYTAMLLVMLTPIILVTRLYQFNKRENLNFGNQSVAEIYQIMLGVFIIYQVHFFICLLEHFLRMDRYVFFCVHRILDAMEFFKYSAMVYIVFRYSTQVKNGFFGDHEMTESTNFGIVLYSRDTYMGANIVA